jgi:hypothetical protein
MTKAQRTEKHQVKKVQQLSEAFGKINLHPPGKSEGIVLFLNFYQL